MQPRTTELINWTTEKHCRCAVDALAKRGFTALYCADAQAAADYILRHAEGAKTIGFGGSLSVADLKIAAHLAGTGKELLNHGLPDLTPEQKLSIMRRQLTCDLFLTGTNALTLDGLLVNIDGNGNRVAAMMFGPAKVIIVAGRNKLVDGDLCAALRRVKAHASPPNAMRLSKQTPCALTGTCADCKSPQRICRITTALECKPPLTDTHVLVVNEDMGL
ncbi:MAG: lactate utilization protein [Kiritimatiellaeota bacterium]|nr:lactate utilization protein [Kiritimatiellota bacterium]